MDLLLAELKQSIQKVLTSSHQQHPAALNPHCQFTLSAHFVTLPFLHSMICACQLQLLAANQGGVIVFDGSSNDTLNICVQVDRLLEHG